MPPKEVCITESSPWWQGFAVEGVRWRRFIDWAALHLPDALHPVLIWIGSVVCYFAAAPARRSVVRNLALVFPNSGALMNHLRTISVFANFGWMLADSAVNRLRHARFTVEIEGENYVNELGRAEGAIVLTAHMGNYDFGAATFAKKFNRHLRMIRAPEPDVFSARHVDVALHQAGAVKVDYSDKGPALAFDLLNALRAHEIISIQGDRVVGSLARAAVKLFGRDVLLPAGPFVLAFAAEAPIYPLFIVRTGFRKYKVIAFAAILLSGDHQARDEQVAEAMNRWAGILEDMVRVNWRQWYPFRPLF